MGTTSVGLVPRLYITVIISKSRFGSAGNLLLFVQYVSPRIQKILNESLPVYILFIYYYIQQRHLMDFNCFKKRIQSFKLLATRHYLTVVLMVMYIYNYI